MRSFIQNRPLLTDFLALLGAILISLPVWILVWVALAQLGAHFFDNGCQVRTGCTYDSLIFAFVALIVMPIFFALFIWQVTKLGSFASRTALRWAGLNPDVALA